MIGSNVNVLMTFVGCQQPHINYEGNKRNKTHTKNKLNLELTPIKCVKKTFNFPEAKHI